MSDLIIFLGLHSFCHQCIIRMYQGQNKIVCPICRNENHVPIDNLPVNRDILQFYEAYRSTLNVQQLNEPAPRAE